jgi:hypothetical protein
VLTSVRVRVHLRFSGGLTCVLVPHVLAVRLCQSRCGCRKRDACRGLQSIAWMQLGG